MVGGARSFRSTQLDTGTVVLARIAHTSHRRSRDTLCVGPCATALLKPLWSVTMSTLLASELLRPILSEHEPQPFERVVGREKILRIYEVMAELRKQSSIIAFMSTANTSSLLSWRDAATVLEYTNAEFRKHAGSLGLVEAGWLETVTQGGTEHVEWARGICNRPHHAVFELPYQGSIREVFGSYLPPEAYEGRDWVAFPEAGVLFVSNAAAHDGEGQMDVFLMPDFAALVAQAIRFAAEKLGQKRTYPELYERCFKQPLAA